MINDIRILQFLLGLAFFLSACHSSPDYKTVRQQVVDMHDKLMGDEETASRNQLRLDSLARPGGLQRLRQARPELDTTAEKARIRALSKRFDEASDAMNAWMRQFKLDVQGKTNSEAVSYFEAEKRKVIHLDSVYQAAIRASGNYLKGLHIQPDTSAMRTRMRM